MTDKKMPGRTVLWRTPISLVSYWATQDEVLFFAETRNIEDGKLYNQVRGATDYLTVAGTVGSYTFQCPDTAPYLAADTDKIWFKTDDSQRTVTEAELVGYDLQRTPVKYDDEDPNSIRAIMILSSAVTGSKRDKMFNDFWLMPLWDNNLNAYGHIKSNRATQNLWLQAEIIEYISDLTTELSANRVLLLNDLVIALNNGLGGEMSDNFDTFYIRAQETSEAMLKNLAKDAHHSSFVGTPAFVADSGFTPDGSSYIDCNYNPFVDAEVHLQSDASMGFVSLTDTDTDGVDIGIWNGTYASDFFRQTNNFVFKLNADLSAHSTASLDGRGLFIVSRILGSEVPYVNDTAGTPAAELSRTPVNLSFFQGCRNNSGSAAIFSDRVCALVFHGRDFSQAEVTIIKNALKNYFDNIGHTGIIT